MLAQRALASWAEDEKAERMRCGWGVRVCGIEVGLVIPVTALCGRTMLSSPAMCLCASLLNAFLTSVQAEM